MIASNYQTLYPLDYTIMVLVIIIIICFLLLCIMALRSIAKQKEAERKISRSLRLERKYGKKWKK